MTCPDSQHNAPPYTRPGVHIHACPSCGNVQHVTGVAGGDPVSDHRKQTTMNLSHLSNRSIRRAIAREVKAQRLPNSSTKATARHISRLVALNTEDFWRSSGVAHHWQSAPGAVIREWLELHGIGPTIETLSKRLRRAKVAAKHAALVLARAEEQFAKGKVGGESIMNDAQRQLNHACGVVTVAERAVAASRKPSPEVKRARVAGRWGVRLEKQEVGT